MKRYAPFLLLFGLGGCMHFSRSVCPDPVHFTREEQHRAALEVESLPDDSALVDMILKYNRVNEYLKGLK